MSAAELDRVVTLARSAWPEVKYDLMAYVCEDSAAVFYQPWADYGPAIELVRIQHTKAAQALIGLLEGLQP